MAQKLTKVAESTTLANTDTMIVVDESVQNSDGTTGALKRIKKEDTGFALASSTNSKIDTKADAIVKTASGSIASFSDGGDDLPLKSLKVNITPKQSGSGDPSPSNVRPISGWDSVNITRSAFNLWDGEQESGYINTSNGTLQPSDSSFRTKNFVPIVPDKYYCFYNSNSSGIRLAFYDINKTYVSGFANNNANPQTLKAPANAYYAKFYSSDMSKVCLSFHGADDGKYEEPNAEYLSISLGQTVYGGVLDVVSGELTLTKSVRTISGTDVISAYSEGTGFWRVNVSATQIPTTAYPEILANKYVGRTSYNAIGNNDNSVGINNATFSQFLLKDTTLTTVDGLKSALNTTPLVICYPLATPTEIQLTPTEVKTLLGNNNIWADSGSVEVEYRADTTLAYNELLSLIASL